MVILRAVCSSCLFAVLVHPSLLSFYLLACFFSPFLSHPFFPSFSLNFSIPPPPSLSHYPPPPLSLSLLFLFCHFCHLRKSEIDSLEECGFFFFFYHAQLDSFPACIKFCFLISCVCFFLPDILSLFFLLCVFLTVFLSVFFLLLSFLLGPHFHQLCLNQGVRVANLCVPQMVVQHDVVWNTKCPLRSILT